MIVVKYSSTGMFMRFILLTVKMNLGSQGSSFLKMNSLSRFRSLNTGFSTP